MESKSQKQDRKAYMKEYMSNYYKTNQGKEQKRGLIRYYKKTNNISEEDKEQYKDDLALMVKTFNCLDKILEHCPQHLQSIFERYLDKIEIV
jgi:hypothetical protein